MKLHRIKAVLLQEYYSTIKQLEVIIDLFYFSLITVVVNGYITLFLFKSINATSAYYLLLGMLLWEIIRVSQYSISLAPMWNIWSRNLSNMFIAPLTMTEYIVAQLFSSIIKTIIIFLMVSSIAFVFFHFNIFSLGVVNLCMYFINLIIFAWTIGLILIGLIFRFGTRIQALSWSSIFIFQPLSASFFPLHFLPGFIQKISLSLPTTYVFESARSNLRHAQPDFERMIISFALNILYFIIAIGIFYYLLNKSKESGQFARNET